MGEQKPPGADIQKLRTIAGSQVPPLTLEQFIRQEYTNSTDKGIASRHDVSSQVVSRLRRQFGIPAHSPQEIFGQRPLEVQEKIREHGTNIGKGNNKIAFPGNENITQGIRRRLAEGATWEEIARDAGITVNGIKSRAQRLHISSPFRPGRKKKARE